MQLRPKQGQSAGWTASFLRGHFRAVEFTLFAKRWQVEGGWVVQLGLELAHSGLQIEVVSLRL